MGALRYRNYVFALKNPRATHTEATVGKVVRRD